MHDQWLNCENIKLMQSKLTMLRSDKLLLLLAMLGARLSSMSPSTLPTLPWRAPLAVSFRKCSRYDICEVGRSKTERKKTKLQSHKPLSSLESPKREEKTTSPKSHKYGNLDIFHGKPISAKMRKSGHIVTDGKNLMHQKHPQYMSNKNYRGTYNQGLIGEQNTYARENTGEGKKKRHLDTKNIENHPHTISEV